MLQNKLFLQLKKKEKGGTAVSAVVSSETRVERQTCLKLDLSVVVVFTLSCII